MAVQTMVVPALDNYFNRGAHSFRQLVGVTYLVDHHSIGDLNWSLVAVLLGHRAKNVKKDGCRASYSD